MNTSSLSVEKRHTLVSKKLCWDFCIKYFHLFDIMLCHKFESGIYSMPSHLLFEHIGSCIYAGLKLKCVFYSIAWHLYQMIFDLGGQTRPQRPQIKFQTSLTPSPSQVSKTIFAIKQAIFELQNMNLKFQDLRLVNDIHLFAPKWLNSRHSC